MPTDDVSDLRDVVDAINKLCATMKTSYDYDDDQEADANPTETNEAPVDTESIPEEPEAPQAVDQMEDAVDTWSEPALPADVAAEMYYSAIAEASLDMWNDSISEMSQPEPTRTYGAVYKPPSDTKPKTERFAEHAPAEGGPGPAEIEAGPPKVATELKSAPPKEPTEIESSPLDPVEVETDQPKGPSSEQTETLSVTSEERRADKYETEAAAYETTSEMYYTASSEVSLLSDADLMEKVTEGHDESDKEKSDRNIMAGHVAAMRERFESMTRANTPCPDLGRAASPSLDMFRNITPSPDFLDKS